MRICRLFAVGLVFSLLLIAVTLTIRVLRLRDLICVMFSSPPNCSMMCAIWWRLLIVLKALISRRICLLKCALSWLWLCAVACRCVSSCFSCWSCWHSLACCAAWWLSWRRCSVVSLFNYSVSQMASSICWHRFPRWSMSWVSCSICSNRAA